MINVESPQMKRKLRVASQLIFLTAFLGLAAWGVRPTAGPIPADIFLRFDPLLAVGVALAGRSIAAVARFVPWALLTLASAVVLGRAFCGWVCPLGTTFDIADRFFTRFGRNSSRPAGAMAKAKFIVLGVLVGLAILGFNVAGWLDPISLSTRTAAMTIRPAFDYAAGSVLPRSTDPPKEDAEGAQALDRSGASFRLYRWGAVFGGILAVLLALQLFAKRFWCRAICPLGALLGLAGARRVIGPVIGSECVGCGQCDRACPTGAIVKDPSGARFSLATECTLCMDCIDVCPAQAVRLGRPERVRVQPSPVPGRRAVLATGLAALAVRPVLALNFQRDTAQQPAIRPPGVGDSPEDEERFLDLCLRCGACMKACPNNALHPSALENGLEGLWTPVIVPARGYCLYECVPAAEGGETGNYCGLACPTGAIRPLTRKEKKQEVLGTAYVRRSRCVTYTSGQACDACARACPTGAIYMAKGTFRAQSGTERAVDHPVVCADRCIGCGQCEYVCPVKGVKGVAVGRPQRVPSARDARPLPRRRRLGKRGAQ